MRALHARDDRLAFVLRIQLQHGGGGRSGQRTDDRGGSMRLFALERATDARRRIARNGLGRARDCVAFDRRAKHRGQMRQRSARQSPIGLIVWPDWLMFQLLPKSHFGNHFIMYQAMRL